MLDSDFPAFGSLQEDDVRAAPFSSQLLRNAPVLLTDRRRQPKVRMAFTGTLELDPDATTPDDEPSLLPIGDADPTAPGPLETRFGEGLDDPQRETDVASMPSPTIVPVNAVDVQPTLPVPMSRARTDSPQAFDVKPTRRVSRSTPRKARTPQTANLLDVVLGVALGVSSTFVEEPTLRAVVVGVGVILLGLGSLLRRRV